MAGFAALFFLFLSPLKHIRLVLRFLSNAICSLHICMCVWQYVGFFTSSFLLYFFFLHSNERSFRTSHLLLLALLQCRKAKKKLGGEETHPDTSQNNEKRDSNGQRKSG